MYNEKMTEQGWGMGAVCVCVCAACVCRDFEILSIIFTWEKNSSAAERKCEHHR